MYLNYSEYMQEIFLFFRSEDDVRASSVNYEGLTNHLVIRKCPRILSNKASEPEVISKNNEKKLYRLQPGSEVRPLSKQQTGGELPVGEGKFFYCTDPSKKFEKDCKLVHQVMVLD